MKPKTVIYFMTGFVLFIFVSNGCITTISLQNERNPVNIAEDREWKRWRPDAEKHSGPLRHLWFWKVNVPLKNKSVAHNKMRNPHNRILLILFARTTTLYALLVMFKKCMKIHTTFMNKSKADIALVTTFTDVSTSRSEQDLYQGTSSVQWACWGEMQQTANWEASTIFILLESKIYLSNWIKLSVFTERIFTSDDQVKRLVGSTSNGLLERLT